MSGTDLALARRAPPAGPAPARASVACGCGAGGTTARDSDVDNHRGVNNRRLEYSGASNTWRRDRVLLAQHQRNELLQDGRQRVSWQCRQSQAGEDDEDEGEWASILE